MRRVDAPTEQAEALTRWIVDEEQRHLLRAEGRVEPRTRFKGGPLVRVADEARHYLFIDESGKSIPGGGPLFALGAIAMTGHEVDRYRRRADRVKTRFFGRTDITLHEPEMRLRENVFYFEGDADQQLAFDRALAGIVRTTTLTAVGVGVRKEAFRDFADAGSIRTCPPTDPRGRQEPPGAQLDHADVEHVRARPGAAAGSGGDGRGAGRVKRAAARSAPRCPWERI